MAVSQIKYRYINNFLLAEQIFCQYCARVYMNAKIFQIKYLEKCLFIICTYIRFHD